MHSLAFGQAMAKAAEDYKKVGAPGVLLYGEQRLLR